MRGSWPRSLTYHCEDDPDALGRVAVAVISGRAQGAGCRLSGRRQWCPIRGSWGQGAAVARRRGRGAGDDSEELEGVSWTSGKASMVRAVGRRRYMDSGHGAMYSLGGRVWPVAALLEPCHKGEVHDSCQWCQWGAASCAGRFRSTGARRAMLDDLSSDAAEQRMQDAA